VIEQGTDGWFAARLGKVTASRVADLMAKTKTGPAASRQNYLAELVCERLTGRRSEGFVSRDMERGKALEPDARRGYEALTGEIVTEAPFVDHPTIPMFGASPDGFVGDTGLVEIKCLNAAGHIEALKSGPPTKYVIQMQVQMLVTGRAWCDYCAFHPDFPEHLQLAVSRVLRDEKHQAEIETAVRAFLAEVDAEVAALQALRAA
jgi:putative phage-type endonuclease